MEPIRLGYNTLWGVVMLALAAGGIVMYVTLGQLMQLMIAVMFVISAALWLTRPFLVVADGVIEAKNMFGLTLKRFRFADLAELEVEDGAIVLGPAEGNVRLKLSRMVISRSDMDRLAAKVREARAARASLV